MTVKILIKGTFKPRGDDEIDLHPHKFVSLLRRNQSFQMKAGDKYFELIETHELNQEAVKYLEDVEMKLRRNEYFEGLLLRLQVEAMNILKLLKYFYGIYHIDEQLLMDESYTWSIDGETWHAVPDRRELKWIPASRKFVLPDNLFIQLLQCHDQNITPFYAFDHLHKAFADEFNPRHQWINGTIALELAIKEFLGRLDSRIIYLIENVPSPPLPKLYKNVLKDYTGEESPYIPIVKKGMEKRNKLVHHPGSPPPNYTETLIYLHQCECAILHLYTLLHKGNEAIKYFYALSQKRLEKVEKDGYF